MHTPTSTHPHPHTHTHKHTHALTMHKHHTHTHTHTHKCLEELGLLIQNNGMFVCGSQPQKTVPLMAAQISDRDNAVRSASLNAMVVVYGNVGEGVFKFTTQVGGAV